MCSNLFVSKREQIACKPTPLAVVVHKQTIPHANQSGVTESEPGISTTRQLNLVAVACDLDCRKTTAMDATRILGCGSDQLGTVGDGDSLVVDDNKRSSPAKRSETAATPGDGG